MARYLPDTRRGQRDSRRRRWLSARQDSTVQSEKKFAYLAVDNLSSACRLAQQHNMDPLQHHMLHEPKSQGQMARVSEVVQVSVAAAASR